MKIVDTAQMRELDRRTIEEAGVKGETLMERAGQGVAFVVRRLADVSGFINPLIHLIAGRGNNGGDAFAAARHLKEMGFQVEVWLAGRANQVNGDALLHMSRMKSVGIAVQELPTVEDWQDAMTRPFFADILVDGVLGIGITGPARGPAVGAIQYIKAQTNDALCVAIDMPSGLNGDTGKAEGDVVIADITVTMGLPKCGMVEPDAIEYVGSIEVVDIGIPPAFINEATSSEEDKELIYVSDLKELFPRRSRSAHKGKFGHVLLMGGARGYAGAITMAAKSAMRSGTGLVTALVPQSIQTVVAGAALEIMVVGGQETSIGSLSSSVWPEWRNRLAQFDAVLIGPGLTRHAESLALVRNMLRECTVPLVIDADAINVMEGQPDVFNKTKHPVVLTPHPGEMARLIEKDIADIQADRSGIAMRVAGITKGVVVLKGAGTVVAFEGRPLQINMTGNPGMATGGTGDVLAGLLVGLLGQGLHPFDAARAAVYLHGRAGDLAAWRKCQTSLVAGDVMDELPDAFREVTLR